MKARDIKVGNFRAWARSSNGYLKPCYACGEIIYLKEDYDKIWRPYESWKAGNAAEGEWIRHDCSSE